jgi:nitroreductase
METLQAIAARRSIRKFTGQAVTRETVEAVLQAAIQAPSGKNRQPWRFVVVAGDEKRAQMIRVMRAGIEDTKARGSAGDGLRLQPGRAGSMDAALGPADVPGGS